MKLITYINKREELKMKLYQLELDLAKLSNVSEVAVETVRNEINRVRGELTTFEEQELYTENHGKSLENEIRNPWK